MLGAAAQALIMAAWWFAQMLVAAVLAVAALALRVGGAALALVALVVRAIAEAVHAIGAVVQAVTPQASYILYCLVCVGVEVGAVGVAFPGVYQAYGRGVTGALLGGLVVVCPLAFALSRGLSWGGLVVAAALTLGIGLAVPVLGYQARALVIAGALGAVVIHFISGARSDEQESGRHTDFDGGGCVDGLHGLP